MLVEQAPRHSSPAAVIAAEVAEKGFEYLRAPIIMVTAMDTSVPYSEPLESYVLPMRKRLCTWCACSDWNWSTATVTLVLLPS